LAVLFVTAGRPLNELRGYFRAGAQETVEGLTNQLSRDVHDRRLEYELSEARQNLIDRQVQLNLSRNQVEGLRMEVSNLNNSVARHSRLLAEAYPILQTAINQQRPTVKFANAEIALADFQHQVDELISQRDSDTRQLEDKRGGLARLDKSTRDGEQALAEMCRALESIEQEVASLKGRREQAESESQTLDLVACATASKECSTTAVNDGVNRMRKEVGQLEARNEGGRSLAPSVVAPNSLTRQWTRLESLKSIHDEFKMKESLAAKDSSASATPATATDEHAVAQPADSNRFRDLDGKNLIIEIRSGERTAAAGNGNNREEARKPGTRNAGLGERPTCRPN